MSILDCTKVRAQERPLTMVTCYDYTSACLFKDTDVDLLLVGDSAAMVMHGHENTITATMEMMVLHTQAVARAKPKQMVIGDMPYMSYRKSLADTVSNAQALMQAGASAIKLEGVTGNLDAIAHLVASGIPVMGHIGLTPQHMHALGGFKVQGKAAEDQQRLLDGARALEQAGCFVIVLECVPAAVAKAVTQAVNIPTIGIGAGSDTDGQVLVFQDLLGLSDGFKPKFVKHFVDGHTVMLSGLNAYVKAVHAGEFPQSVHCYKGELEVADETVS